MKNLNGFLEFDFKEQKTAFNFVYQNLLKNIPLESWSFGGGTALSMYYFLHRASFDIDIFINDPQYFGYLSPKFYLEEEDFLRKDYIETANQITLRTKNKIKIDFILTPPLSSNSFKQLKDEGKEFQIETVEEIIAKKIFYRKKDNKIRDILDIAYAIYYDNSNILLELINKNILNLDDLYEFEKSLNKLDRRNFLIELEKIKPSKKLNNIVNNVKDIIIDNINNVKKTIKNDLNKNNIKKIKKQQFSRKKIF